MKREPIHTVSSRAAIRGHPENTPELRQNARVRVVLPCTQATSRQPRARPIKITRVGLSLAHVESPPLFNHPRLTLTTAVCANPVQPTAGLAAVYDLGRARTLALLASELVTPRAEAWRNSKASDFPVRSCRRRNKS